MSPSRRDVTDLQPVRLYLSLISQGFATPFPPILVTRSQNRRKKGLFFAAEVLPEQTVMDKLATPFASDALGGAGLVTETAPGRLAVRGAFDLILCG